MVIVSNQLYYYLVEADEEVTVGESDRSVSLAAIREKQPGVHTLVIAPHVRAVAVPIVVHPIALILLKDKEQEMHKNVLLLSNSIN